VLRVHYIRTGTYVCSEHQFVRDLVRERRLYKRERLACVINDVGIRHAGVQVASSVIVVKQERFIKALGTHPSIAVPGGASVF
jgi:hypothetical protein